MYRRKKKLVTVVGDADGLGAEWRTKKDEWEDLFYFLIYPFVYLHTLYRIHDIPILKNKSFYKIVCDYMKKKLGLNSCQ